MRVFSTDPRQSPPRVPTGKRIDGEIRSETIDSIHTKFEHRLADDNLFSGIIVELGQLLLHFSDHKKDQCQFIHNFSTTNNNTSINSQDEGHFIFPIHCCIVYIHTAAL